MLNKNTNSNPRTQTQKLKKTKKNKNKNKKTRTQFQIQERKKEKKKKKHPHTHTFFPSLKLTQKNNTQISNVTTPIMPLSLSLSLFSKKCHPNNNRSQEPKSNPKATEQNTRSPSISTHLAMVELKQKILGITS